MTACTQRLGDRTGLLCVRTDEHTTHVFHASWAEDAVRDEEADRG